MAHVYDSLDGTNLARLRAASHAFKDHINSLPIINAAKRNNKLRRANPNLRRRDGDSKEAVLKGWAFLEDASLLDLHWPQTPRRMTVQFDHGIAELVSDATKHELFTTVNRGPIPAGADPITYMVTHPGIVTSAGRASRSMLVCVSIRVAYMLKNCTLLF